MELGSQTNLRSSGASDTSMLKQQLEKEVTCLVRQLDRVRTNDEHTDCATLKNFESMIESRRKMLHNLPVGSIAQTAMGAY